MTLQRSTILVPMLLLFAAPLLQAQPGEEERRFKLAQGYEQSGDLPSASRVYRELYDADPQSDVYFEGVRRTYMMLLKHAELLPLVEARVKRMPNDAMLRSLYADLLNRVNRGEEAAEQWEEALDRGGKSQLIYAIVAQAQAENRLFEKAIGTFRRAREEMGAPTIFADQIAELLAILGRFEDASREYIAMLQENPSGTSQVIGGLSAFTSNPSGAAAAIAAVEAASKERPDFLPLLDVLSWLYTERGDYERSLEVAQRLDEARKGRGSGIYAYADRAMREGAYDAAIRAYELFQKNYDKSNPLHGAVMLNYTRTLGLRYKASGASSRKDAEELIERYEAVVAEQKGAVPAAEALLEIARLQADELDDATEAIETIETLRREYPRFPSLPEAMLLQGDLYLRTGDVGRAQALYRKGADTLLRGQDGERYRDLSALRYAETLFYLGQFKEAVDAFTALTENTSSESTNDALQYLFLLQETFEKNDDALRHYATGRLLLAQRKGKEAMEELERAAALAPGSSLAELALFGRSQAQETAGDHQMAITTLLELVTKFKDGSYADRALFRAAELTETRSADKAKALELYLRVLTEYPSSTYAAKARTKVRALRGDGREG